MTPHAHRMIRHTVVFRTLEVLRVERLTPHMQRIVFGGTDLRGFASAAPDDHVKLFFPNSLGEIVTPVMGPNGPTYPAGPEYSPMRDYTPRRYDSTLNELTVDFVLHGDGPASNWAVQASPGQRIGAGGPRGSNLIADDFDTYVLVGDETALPAIGRRLEEMPEGTRVEVLAEIPSADDRQSWRSSADVNITWLERDGATGDGSDLLEQALRALSTPAGDTFYWIATESHRTRNMRLWLSQERGVPKDWMKAKGYWQAGTDEDGEDG
ncbi:siderophore-interacting protein [Rhodanobacter sp. C05]|uniref:siderophore-interacting protein n=1 Tax=Rhodanobacter sp. C05 TaxID=1945855 RepID=UPI000986819D|nr:siderophore-interacting protein [Rhodanobacter sp. C05]OOG38119.1 NADPH-dependent ferric siderophore reductase [Rhodanobacter sp. C05]